MPARRSRLALLTFLVVPAACGTDAPPADPDGGDEPRVDGSVIDGAPIDTPPPELDGGIDGTIDGMIDAPIDSPIDGPELPRWGLTFPGEEVESMVTVGARTYVLTWSGSASPLRLRTIVDRQVTATQTLTNGGGGRLATDGQSLYVLLRFQGIVTLWGETVGEPGASSFIVAKLDDTLTPRWTHVDSDYVAYAAGFDVAATGDAVLGLVRHAGNSFSSELYVLAGATGTIGTHRSLPHLGAVAISSTGRVFAGGNLYTGETLHGHTATASEHYLIKLVGSSISFSRFDASTSISLIGVHDGDPILSGTTADGGRTISRHSGASGAPLWTARYDAGGLVTADVASAGTGAMYLHGTFQDRIDFSPSLRLETAGDQNFYLAELDATTGAVRTARQFGSAAHDGVATVEHGTCPLLGGTLRGALTHGRGVLSVPDGSSGAFVATACPPAM